MSQVTQVKQATDIVQVIGERLSLQRSGTNLKANCPFHGEKTPSFFVNEQFQRYKCFGCGESGDAFTFLQKYEGMTFGEALRHLADKAGIELTSYTQTPEDNQRERLLSVLNLAKEYYHFLLTKHEVGEKARQYLKERGVTSESIKVFQLGYALPSWEGLLQYLVGKKKYDLADLQAAGLVVTNQSKRSYDRFRDRIMFPLTNHRGQVVGFSGRTLQADAKEAKYINTPETSLYHKSQMLYGYHELFQEIRKKKEVIVVEGEFDVISSAQAHVNHVVAIKGSALTSEHVKLLGRVAERVILSLDADSAGIEATKRAIKVAQPLGMELRVIQIPSGKDPDELARKEPATWREVVKAHESVYSFFLQAALKQHDPNSPEGKRKIMLELGPILVDIPLAVEREVYIKRLAVALEVREELIKTDLEQIKRRRLTPRVFDKADESAQVAPTLTPDQQRRLNVERYAIFLLLRSTGETLAKRSAQLSPTWFSHVPYQVLVQALQPVAATFHLEKFVATLAEDQQQALFEIYLWPEFVDILEKVDLDKEWRQVLKDLKNESVKGQVREIEDKLRKLDELPAKTTQQEAEQDELLKELVALQRGSKAN